MKQLHPNGRYFVPLTAHEYVAMPISAPDSPYAYVLQPPPDTTYPNAPILVAKQDGTLWTKTTQLPITVDDLNFTGRVHIWEQHNNVHT